MSSITTPSIKGSSFSVIFSALEFFSISNDNGSILSLSIISSSISIALTLLITGKIGRSILELKTFFGILDINASISEAMSRLPAISGKSSLIKAVISNISASFNV